ncbi:MAG: hypothetical protein A2Z18_10275, partial [Armatimonadetes bacterium RBG_16_58_9]
MKRFYVENLREGDRIEDVFVVASRSLQRTRGGSPFLKARLADKTGSVDAVKWDAKESEITRLAEGAYVRARGAVRVYNGELQVNIESFETCDESIDPSDFIPSSERDRDQMMRELAELLSEITNADLKWVLDYFLDDEDFVSRFREAPAAKSVHHACLGGLAEHTINVVRNCIALAGLYPDADRDLLLAAAALHDVGKVDEYTWSRTIDYSDEGRLVGHVAGGAMMVRQAIQARDGFDELLGLALQHAVLAHHGSKEYGSPVEPRSIEALILHAADKLDADVDIFREAIKQSDRSGDAGLFTKRHYLLDRPIFKGMREEESEQDMDVLDESVDSDLFAVDANYDPF